MPKEVSYVVGVTLDGPTVVTHVVEDEPKEQVTNGKPAPSVQPIAAGQPRPQQGVKRTCGQSQKSVRVKHAEKK